MKNEMELVFDAVSENEGFARTVVAAFIMNLNPTLEELEDIQIAVSEAVTNAIIHGYEGQGGKVYMTCSKEEDRLQLSICDKGKGIADVTLAMRPFYTTAEAAERSGMGFAFMEAFMDEVQVESEPGKSTRVMMKKKIGNVVREGQVYEV